MAKETAGSRRRPGLVALLLFGLLVCARIWGQDSSTQPGSLPAAELQGGVTTARGEFTLKPWTEIRRHRVRPLYTRPAGLMLFLPGPLLFLAVLLLPRTRRRGWPLLMLFLLLGSRNGTPDPGREALSAEEVFARGDLRRAVEIYTVLEEKFPDNPALLYNLAVCRHLLGERGAAVYLLRRSLDRNPGDRETRAVLVALEKKIRPKRPAGPAAAPGGGAVLRSGGLPQQPGLCRRRIFLQAPPGSAADPAGTAGGGRAGLFGAVPDAEEPGEPPGGGGGDRHGGAENDPQGNSKKPSPASRRHFPLCPGRGTRLPAG